MVVMKGREEKKRRETIRAGERERERTTAGG
jgi:hypothetical protein